MNREMLQTFNQYLAIWKEFVTSIITFLGLVLIYVLGIGVTAIFAKLVNKSFLNLKPVRSSWAPFRSEHTSSLEPF